MNWLVGRFKYAFEGIRDGICHDKSILFQCFLGLVALIFAAVLHCSIQEWLWILLCITLVIVGEIFNSCIEKCVDYISLERNPQAKLIKDMAAAAVLFNALFSLVVACIIFIPKLIR